jgi:secretion/DNA translocation related TadE-like protein
VNIGAGGRSSEGGAATILVVAMAGVLMFVMVGLAAAGGLVVAERRAQAAADLAALGGAGDGVGCVAAARVAAANAAVLEACEVVGRDVRVTVSVSGPRVPWRSVRVAAEARAGPG